MSHEFFSLPLSAIYYLSIKAIAIAFPMIRIDFSKYLPTHFFGIVVEQINPR
ncbi:MAG: hypothetical protein M3O33_06060 [Cyanobacteriota bacterium]|nr:hypothetical protein [Cyanobacteriota bacterium]